MSPPSPAELLARLREASAQSDLRADRRLDAKLDLSPASVQARLREASDLLLACRELEKLGRSNRD